MKRSTPVKNRYLFFFFLLTLCCDSVLSAQEAKLLTSTSPIGYDTTVTAIVRVKDLPPLAYPINIQLTPFEYAPDFTLDSITIIDDSTLSFRINTGTSIQAGLKTFYLSFAETGVATSNGVLIAATRFGMISSYPRRGYSKKYEFFTEPHVTTFFSEDSILSMTCYDSLGNVSQDIVFDSIQMGSGNSLRFYANVNVNASVHSGKFKIVLYAKKNGILKYYFTIEPPRIIDPIGAIRGTNFAGLTYTDYNYNTLFLKGKPNDVKVYRNGVLRTDIVIDSTKAISDEKLALYGKVPANAEFGKYDLILQNEFDTLSLVFTVFKPQIQRISTKYGASRRVYRGDSSMATITMLYANLNKGITTVSLLNPADSSFIRISNFSVTNANTCKFILQVDSFARLGNYYIKLTNSFDTISIIDSFFMLKGVITKSVSTISSESRAAIELQGFYTVFKHSTPSITAIPSLGGTLTVDSISIISDTKLILWLTADPLAAGTAKIYYYSNLDDSILVTSTLTIKRPQAYISTKNSGAVIGLKDTITISIIGSATHFKRLEKIQFSYFVPMSGGTTYDTSRINILNYTAQNDSLLSLTIYTNEDSVYDQGPFHIVLFDSLSGILQVGYGLYIATPTINGNFRNTLKKQATDTLWVPLSYFSESQVTDIDSIYFQENNAHITAIAVTGYAYQSIGTKKGILVNLSMNKTIKSTDYAKLTIVWNYGPYYSAQSNLVEILEPVFVSKVIPHLEKDSVDHCVIVFDGLYEDSVVLNTYDNVMFTNIEIKGDTVEFDVTPLSQGYLTYYLTTPNEDEIYNSVFYVSSSVGINEDAASLSSFKLYPVPAHNSIFIQSNNNTIIESIEIYNILGQRFQYEGSTAVMQNIQLNDLPVGAYSMLIHTSEGTVIRKFIKE